MVAEVSYFLLARAGGAQAGAAALLRQILRDRAGTSGDRGNSSGR